MASIKIEKQYGETKRAVLKGLVAYNTQKAGKMDFAPLSISLREKGEIVGGVVGEMFFGWMFVSLFWIDDSIAARASGSGCSKPPKRKRERKASRTSTSTRSAFRRPRSTRSLATASSAG